MLKEVQLTVNPKYKKLKCTLAVSPRKQGKVEDPRLREHSRELE